MVQWLTPIFVRLVNSRYLLRICKKDKFVIICALQSLSWILFCFLAYGSQDQDGSSLKSPSENEVKKIESEEQHSPAKQTPRTYIMPVAFACFLQVIAFTLNECVIFGLMKDVPQELTIPYNIGKSAGTFIHILCFVALTNYGIGSIWYWFGAALLPAPVYFFSVWFIKAIS